MPVNVGNDVGPQDYFSSRPDASTSANASADNADQASFHSVLQRTSDENSSGNAQPRKEAAAGTTDTNRADKNTADKNTTDKKTTAGRDVKRDREPQDGTANSSDAVTPVVVQTDAKPLAIALPVLTPAVPEVKQSFGPAADQALQPEPLGSGATSSTDLTKGGITNSTLATSVLTNLFARAGVTPSIAPLATTSKPVAKEVAARAGEAPFSSEAKASLPAGQALSVLDTVPGLTILPALQPQTGPAPSGGANTAAFTPAVGAAGVSSAKDPIVLTAQPTQAATAIETTPKNLAFAMRLTGDRSGDTGNAAAAPSTANVFAHAVTNSVMTANSGKFGGQSNGSESNASNAYFVNETSVTGSKLSAEPGATPVDNQAAAPAATNEATTVNAGTPEPVRNMLLQLRGDDNRRVDIRMVSSGGELHFTVKAGDPELTSRLQEHMPELTSRLDSERISNEVFVPKVAEATRTEQNGSQDLTNGSYSSQNGRETGSQSQGRNPQQRGRPDWVDLLESQN